MLEAGPAAAGGAVALAAPAAAGGAGDEGPAARACAVCGKSQAQAAAGGGKLLRCTGCGKVQPAGGGCAWLGG